MMQGAKQLMKGEPHLMPTIFPRNPIHLNLIFEKSSSKNQVAELDFKSTYFELDFYCLCKIDFCRSKIQFVELNFSNLNFQKSGTVG